MMASPGLDLAIRAVTSKMDAAKARGESSARVFVLVVGEGDRQPSGEFEAALRAAGFSVSWRELSRDETATDWEMTLSW